MVMPSTLESDITDPLVGQVLGGKYTLERLIGRGGMGHVYLAHDGKGRRVVVKVIAPSLAQQPQAMARFEREAQRLDGLRHSNIVEMYEHGTEDGRGYIAMEFVDGELLNEYLARKGALTMAEFVPIAAQILKGVGHAHSRDLMIRDIKPANVMLCERKGRANFVKIIDFGLAKMLEGDADITKQHFIGTSGYLSPEQIKGLQIDLRVDVYALGVLFYQMLAGRMPFEAENDTTLLYKHVHEFPTPLVEVLPEGHQVPDELVHMIHDCLEKDPPERPQDANEIVEKLIDCVPMSMFRLPPAGLDAPPTAGDTGAISALSTAALAAPTGETANFPTVDRYMAAASVAGAVPEEDQLAAERSLDAGFAATPTYAAEIEEPGKRKTGLIIGVLVGVAAAVAIGYLVLSNSSKDGEGGGQAQVGNDLEGTLAKAEKLFADGDLDGADKALSTVRAQLDAAPELAGRVEDLDEKIEVGQLMQTAKKLDDEGKVAAAISAYEDVLEADSSNAEARERLSELREDGEESAEVSITSDPVAELTIDGSPAGTTPYDDTLSIGKHTIEIRAEGYETWEEEFEIEAGENAPIEVDLSREESGKKKPVNVKKPAATDTPVEKDPPEKKPEEKQSGDNPFLPTEKKKPDGPFLPTQK